MDERRQRGALGALLGASYSNLGNGGHINAEAGFGPLPVAKSWVEAARARVAAEQRPRRAEFREWSSAV